MKVEFATIGLKLSLDRDWGYDTRVVILYNRYQQQNPTNQMPTTKPDLALHRLA